MVYLIGGEARSGKTIIRKRLLKEYQISGIGTDSIRYMLAHTLKDSSIDHNNPPEINGPLMWPYISNLVEDLIVYTSEDFVIEGDILLPEYLKEYKDNPDVSTCYIGYSSISISQKIENILNFRKEGDWTSEYAEKELRKFVKWGIKESQKYQRECKKLGIQYYDLSENFKEGIDRIIQEIR